VTTHPPDEFWEACGGTDPLEITVHGPEGARERRALAQPFALVGRSAEADLCLADAQVSRRHAYLQVLAGRAFCLDLHSRTGVFFDDVLQPAGWLPEGPGLRLGPYRLDVAEAGVPTWDPLTEHWPGPEPLHSVTVDIRNGDRRIIWKPLRVLSMIGCAPECKVRIWSQRVSRYTGSLVRTPKGVWVIDLLGKARIQVNGAVVRHARLRTGDRVQVGDFLLRIRADGPEDGPAPAPALPTQPSRALTTTRQLPPSPRDDDPYPLPSHQELLNGFGELIPAGADQPAPGVLALINVFSALQEQMFEQLQQALLPMSQMFDQLRQTLLPMSAALNSLQLDQSAFLREEMGRLQELTRELQAVKAELAALRAAKTGTDAPARQEEPASSRRASAAGANGAIPAARPPFPHAPSDSAPELGGEEIHELLLRRMALLTEERQTRWQKILQFLSGRKTAGDPAAPT
jgi:pSer/pThr/pTyr-binding forkhead associated (FHA) protein